MSWIQPWKDGVAVVIKATPRASRTACLGEESGWLRVALQAPPVDGKANDALRRWLSDTFNLPKNAPQLLSGQTGRLKRWYLPGVDEAAVREKLLG